MLNLKRLKKQVNMAWMPLITSHYAYIGLSLFAAVFIHSFTTNKASHAQSAKALPDTLHCKLKEVIDGDTITAVCEPALSNTLHIRISDIDAPEIDQKHFGHAAKDALSKILEGQANITLKTQGYDIYERVLAEVFIADENIGLWLVEAGYAVVYKQYNPPSHYLTAMQAAKQQKLGVWGRDGLHQNPRHYRQLAY